MFRWIFLFSVLLTSGVAVHADVTATSGDALARLLERGTPVIDIRTPEEWLRTGVIEGSQLVTFFDARGRYDVKAFTAALSGIVQRDERFILICRTGGRTGRVTRFLNDELGYRHVLDARGGILRWIEEGRPTVSPAL